MQHGLKRHYEPLENNKEIEPRFSGHLAPESADPRVVGGPRSVGVGNLRTIATASVLLSGAAALLLGRQALWARVVHNSHASGMQLDSELLKLNADGVWKTEHIGFFKNELSGLCLDLDEKNDDKAIVSKCAFDQLRSSQKWVVDPATGFMRNLLSGGKCLDVEGDPGWRNGARLIGAACNYTGDPDTTDQLWKFNAGGFIVNTLSGKCVDVQGDGNSNSAGSPVEIYHCEFNANSTDQKWKFVGMAQVVSMQGLEAGRPAIALRMEEARRHAVHVNRAGLLTMDDVMRAVDPAVLLNGAFWVNVEVLFGDMIPEWSDWNDLFTLWGLLGQAGAEQGSLGSSMLLNILSNMVFAGMNFVQGFTGPNLDIWGIFKLNLEDFTGLTTHDCRARMSLQDSQDSPTGEEKKGADVCHWQKPKAGETVSIVSLEEYLNKYHSSKLPPHTFFANLYTGSKIPSTEDNIGRYRALSLMDAGIAAARARGIEPMQLVSNATSTRFSFDVEGLTMLFGTVFGWQKPREVKYSSNGAFGAGTMEKLMQTYGDSRDALGLLMTDSVLSMHLTHDGSTFVVDLTGFERYKPILGYAKLGGKAVFKQNGDRLVTVQLEYNGQTYTNFDDKRSDDDYIVKSKLSGWRFAQAAIIASLMAKTQLLVHVKTIHLELAPAFQAVTVDAFAGDTRHPLRRLLEPFISRNIQATQSNLKVWFEYRAAEFGLAPLPIQEQLKLIQHSTQEEPLNMADLDMERYAKVRGMEQFTGDNVQAGAWRWKWHDRALKVQRLYDELLECWLGQYYGQQNSDLTQDKMLMDWWHSLVKHVPALRLAAFRNTDWVTSAQTTTSTTSTATSTALPATTPVGSPATTKSVPTVEVRTLQRPPTAQPVAQPPLFHSILQRPPTAQPVAQRIPQVRELKLPRSFPGWTRRLAWGFDKNGEFRSIVSDSAKAKIGQVPLAENVAEPTELQYPRWSLRGYLSDEPAFPTPIRVLAQDQGALRGYLPDERAFPTTATTTLFFLKSLEDQPLPGLNIETLKNVLRTYMVWASWVHEDVGHSAATLVYNPVYSPTFVPEDGVGIPLAPLNLVVSAYRNFVALERGKLLDVPPPYWFDEKKCKEYFGLVKRCTDPKDDKQCFMNFQAKLEDLRVEREFSACDEEGLYSCVDRVETSSSS